MSSLNVPDFFLQTKKNTHLHFYVKLCGIFDDYFVFLVRDIFDFMTSLAGNCSFIFFKYLVFNYSVLCRQIDKKAK